jgi:hypothetical protein
MATRPGWMGHRRHGPARSTTVIAPYHQALSRRPEHVLKMNNINFYLRPTLASYRYQKKKSWARRFEPLRLGVAVLVPFNRCLPYVWLICKADLYCLEVAEGIRDIEGTVVGGLLLLLFRRRSRSRLRVRGMRGRGDSRETGKQNILYTDWRESSRDRARFEDAKAK